MGREMLLASSMSVLPSGAFLGQAQVQRFAGSPFILLSLTEVFILLKPLSHFTDVGTETTHRAKWGDTEGL